MLSKILWQTIKSDDQPPHPQYDEESPFNPNKLPQSENSAYIFLTQNPLKEYLDPIRTVNGGSSTTRADGSTEYAAEPLGRAALLFTQALASNRPSAPAIEQMDTIKCQISLGLL